MARQINPSVGVDEDNLSHVSYNVSDATSETSRFQHLQIEATRDRDVHTERKIESKDHMWKPAPIMGREF